MPDPKNSVLVIDDEYIVRSSLAAYLDDIGYTVFEAGNGAEGLEAVRSHAPDLVLTDLRMPVMDGFALVERMKVEFPETPVIVVSGAGKLSDAIRALQLGGWDYLSKPIEDFEAIDLAVNRVLDRARLKRENRVYRERLEQLVEERTRQLRESQERYRQMFMQHEDAVLLCTAGEQRIVEVNPAFMELFGYYPADLIGQYASRLFPAATWQELTGRLERLRNREFVFYERMTAIDRNGSQLTISCKGWLVRFETQTLIYLSMRDMGEKERLEEEMRATQSRLIQANKMTSLGMLVSGMGHEINNPNNFIAVNAATLAEIWRDAALQLAEQGDDGILLGGLPLGEANEAAGRLIDGIRRGSERIAAVVKGLKEYSRSDQGTLRGVFRIADVLGDTRTILDHQIQSRTDHFEIDCPDDCPDLCGNRQQIEQVMINLLMNALQALPDRSRGVRIRVTPLPADGTVRLEVIDEGVGMPPEVLARATEPFFSTRLDQGGTGLGLSICASIIRDHGGTLQFSSTTDSGCCAAITLPMAGTTRCREMS